jgi:hypothetical protein
MSRAITFKKTDVTRATRAVLDAGLDVARVEIEKDGRIVVVPGKAPEPAHSKPLNQWDEVLPTNGTVAEIR